jgi:hypothetical protein
MQRVLGKINIHESTMGYKGDDDASPSSKKKDVALKATMRRRRRRRRKRLLSRMFQVRLRMTRMKG